MLGGNMYNKKEYIVRQLHRTHNKKFENYVITRIWHLINDLDIKIITQQYVRKTDEEYYLIDLYFPQFNFCVEVDEPYHLSQQDIDNNRERDIINTTGFTFARIDTSQDIDNIHKQIDEKVIKKINNYKSTGFKEWDYDKEFDNEQYIEKGYIDVNDNAIFRKEVDAYNCFGNKNKILRTGGAKHKYIDNVNIWFPKLYKHGEWENKIDLDENTIYESNIYKIKNDKAINDWLNTKRNVRYVFAQSKDNLGRTLYRFKGEYTLNKEKTIKLNKAVWERTNTRVKTIRH